jgi:hypothetical protein
MDSFDLLWKRYGLIVELTRLLEEHHFFFYPQKLQHLVYLLQERYDKNYGYQFDIKDFLPLCNQLSTDLFLVEHWQGIVIRDHNRIELGPKAEELRTRSERLLVGDYPQIFTLVKDYGRCTRKELALISKVIYLESCGYNTKQSIVDILLETTPDPFQFEVLKMFEDLILRGRIQFRIIR